MDKIFGPGNQYVTAAKMALANSEAMVAIDMPAGPSEVLVIADAGAPPAHVAADLLSQAEHGPDSQARARCTEAVEPGAAPRRSLSSVGVAASKCVRAGVGSAALHLAPHTESSVLPWLPPHCIEIRACKSPRLPHCPPACLHGQGCADALRARVRWCCRRAVGCMLA